MDDKMGRSFAFEECLVFVLTRAARVLAREADAAARGLDSTYSQLSVLSMMTRDVTNTPRELAACLDVDSAAISRVLDRLEHGGLLVRSRSFVDRRVVYATLTDKGKHVAARAPIVMNETLSGHLSGFTATELGELHRLLGKLIAC